MISRSENELYKYLHNQYCLDKVIEELNKYFDYSVYIEIEKTENNTPKLYLTGDGYDIRFLKRSDQNVMIYNYMSGSNNDIKIHREIKNIFHRVLKYTSRKVKINSIKDG